MGKVRVTYATNMLDWVMRWRLRSWAVDLDTRRSAVSGPLRFSLKHAQLVKRPSSKSRVWSVLDYRCQDIMDRIGNSLPK